MATPSYVAFGDGALHSDATGVISAWTGTPAPTAPVAAYITRAGNLVTVRFDKEITRVNSNLAWSDGFTIQLDAVTTAPAIVRNVVGGIEFEYQSLTATAVTVAYAGTNLVDAYSGTVAVAAFSAVTATAAASVGRSMFVYNSLDANIGLVLAADMAAIVRSLYPITVDPTATFGPRSSTLLTVSGSAQRVTNGSVFSCTMSGGTASERINLNTAWLNEMAVRVACALDELCVQYASVTPSLATYKRV